MNPKHFRKIYIEITNACNLRCSFCSSTNRPTGFMLLPQFAEIIEKIRTHTNHVYLHVKGEPLLHPELSAMLDLCAEKKLQVVLVTNGTKLADKSEMLRSKPAIRQINLSLHCFSELPDLKDKTEYIKTVIEFIKNALSQTSIIISMRFWNMEKGGTDHNPDNRTILKEIEKEFAPGMLLEEELKPGKGLKLSERLYINSDYEFTWPVISDSYDNPNGFCHGLRNQLAILNDGTVVPCCLDAEGIINLGNIYETDIQKIVDSERARKIYDGFSNGTTIEPLCQKCQFKEKFE